MHRNNVHLLHPISYSEYIWCEFFGIFLVFGGVKRKINLNNKPTLQHVANMVYGCVMLLEPARQGLFP